MNDKSNTYDLRDTLMRIQDLLADYAMWIIVVIAFFINIADFFGLTEGLPWLKEKMIGINALLVVGFTLAFQKTVSQVASIDEGMAKVEKTLGIKLREKNLDIFISAPITSFLPVSRKEEDFDEEYYKYFNKVCTSVVKQLKKDHPRIRIHYEGERLLTFKSVLKFDDDRVKMARSFTGIDRSKYLVAIFPGGKLTSGSLIEIGYALARDIPCTVFYPSGARPLNIPSLMLADTGKIAEGRCLNQPYVVEETPEETAQNILQYLRDYLK